MTAPRAYMTPLEAVWWVQEEVAASVSGQGLDVRHRRGAHGMLHVDRSRSALPPRIIGLIDVTMRGAGSDPPAWTSGHGPWTLWSCTLEFEADGTDAFRMDGRREWRWNVFGRDGSGRTFMNQGWGKDRDLGLEDVADRMSSVLRSCVRQGRRWGEDR